MVVFYSESDLEFEKGWKPKIKGINNGIILVYPKTDEYKCMFNVAQKIDSVYKCSADVGVLTFSVNHFNRGFASNKNVVSKDWLNALNRFGECPLVLIFKNKTFYTSKVLQNEDGTMEDMRISNYIQQSYDLLQNIRFKVKF